MSTPAAAASIKPITLAAKGKPVSCGTLLTGTGDANSITIIYKTTLCLDDLKRLLPEHLSGLNFGIPGGSTLTLKPTNAMLESGSSFTDVAANWCATKAIELATEQAVALNPDIAMKLKMAELEAKAAAYDKLLAKEAAREAQVKADYASRNAKMLATKAAKKSASSNASVASSGGNVEPVADEPVVIKKQVKQVKAKAPPATIAELS